MQEFQPYYRPNISKRSFQHTLLKQSFSSSRKTVKYYLNVNVFILKYGVLYFRKTKHVVAEEVLQESCASPERTSHEAAGVDNLPAGLSHLEMEYQWL